MKTNNEKTIKLSKIKLNKDNPRFVRDDRFEKLVKSIKNFPEMMKLRPIIVDENNVILGGNMRFRALQIAGYKEVPEEWVKKASDLTEEQKKEFIIKDNVGFGEWDLDEIANSWDDKLLEEWGFELPAFMDEDEVERPSIDGDDEEAPEMFRTTIHQIRGVFADNIAKKDGIKDPSECYRLAEEKIIDILKKNEYYTT